MHSRADAASACPCLPRSYGRAQGSFSFTREGGTRVHTLFQDGCLKLRLPRSPSEDDAELVVINTAGGLTGGDRTSLEVDVGKSACVTVTTPGSERIYRSREGEAVVKQGLTVRRAGRLDWLPQETILFDGGRLRRRSDLELEDGAEATIVEPILLGRAAMGETVKTGLLSDFWTVRRNGGLMFADAMRITDPFGAAINQLAVLGGRSALATLIHVGEDLPSKCDAIRASFDGVGDLAAGATVVGDVLVARMSVFGSLALRRALLPVLAVLRQDRPLPRLWSC